MALHMKKFFKLVAKGGESMDARANQVVTGSVSAEQAAYDAYHDAIAISALDEYMRTGFAYSEQQHSEHVEKIIGQFNARFAHAQLG